MKKNLKKNNVIHDDEEFEVSEYEENSLDEEVDDDEGNDLSYIPLDEREVFIDKVQLSIFELHRKSVRGDIILQPFYQRKDIWTRPKKSKLIESVLLNISIPSIYFAESKDGKWEVVDGQQRLKSFFDFLDGKYSLTQLPVLNHLKNKSFKDLDSYQRKIEDYQLHIFIIKKESHPDIRFDIFERINEGASQLNAQELRNSIYRGHRIKLLKDLSKNKNFIKLTKGKLQEKRLKDQEAILRFLSFYFKGYDDYNGNLNSFLNDTLENFDIYKKKSSNFSEIFDTTMESIYDVFGSDAFIKAGSQIRRMNMSIFDIISFSFAKCDKQLILNNKHKISTLLENLIESDPEFKRSLTSNTLTKKSLRYRFEKWLMVFNNNIRS